MGKKILLIFLKFLRILFCIVCFAGIGIFILGMAISFSGVGGNSKIFQFFNDSPLGWALMFGSIIIGAIGNSILKKIIYKVEANIGFPSYPSNYSSSRNCSYDEVEEREEEDSSTMDETDDSSYALDDGEKNEIEDRIFYDEDGRNIGYSIGDRYYDDDGKCVGYDIGDRHYDEDGNDKGYRVGDREYDEDGNSIGYWIGDTFYKDE